MINSIVQLAIIVDFVLAVLITTPSRKLNEGFLFHKGSLLSVDGIEFSIVRD
jgi:hypothetical protein